MEIELLTENSIIYVLAIWIVAVIIAKALKLDKHGFEIKLYSIVYKNYNVQSIFAKILAKTRTVVNVFANISIVSGVIMVGVAFWFLLSNILNFFVKPTEFSEVTLLIPGITLTSSTSITYFLLSIPIVLIIHEGAHGIVATLEKIKIKSGGFAVFIAMFAGFVEPDEEKFVKANKISKLKVISAGATSNVIFAIILGMVLITNPFFAIVMPEPLLSWFYRSVEGVTIISLMSDSEAGKSGLQPDDIITRINNTDIKTPLDFQKIKIIPNDVISIDVIRDGKELNFAVKTIENPEDPKSGLIGIIRDNSLPYKPKYDIIEWKSPEISMFLLWLWMISFFIGIINMLPLPILDGGKFIYSIIEGKLKEKSVKIFMIAIYLGTFIIFGLNIALSYIKSGWFTI
ncbi:MAG: site-2 protease family protein [Thaumarchaeota archaeon]|nr:site-2 protease family protein [Nitrososphaerota archaeon]MCY3975827.1 site-2 protease family protein [Nitrososphaerota archaeon]